MGGKTRTKMGTPRPTTRSKRSSTCVDHEGRVYQNQKEMCDAYGVNLSTFRGRRNAGWDLKKALLTKLPNRG